MNVLQDQMALPSERALQEANWTLPIAAAWCYMSDDQKYNKIPSEWSSINFSVVDVLYVGPAGVQAGGDFGLFNSNTTGPLANRFEWVIKRARSQNPNIKIIVSQWWGIGSGNWGSALSSLNDSAAISRYTSSVASFIKDWSSISGGVDGYDIDYESNNVLESTPTILAQVRSKLDTLSEDLDGRHFYITVSPSETEYLDKAVPSISYVNIQTYQGGTGLSPDDFLNIGLNSKQILYGYCPESGCGPPSLDQVEDAYKKYKQAGKTLAGIHLYRLNSDNYEYENQQQEKIYALLHPEE